jgi:hypothetical protein
VTGVKPAHQADLLRGSQHRLWAARAYGDRIAEQAAYFGITPDAAIQIGREASLVRQASGAGEKGFLSASMSCAVFIDASRLSK